MKNQKIRTKRNISHQYGKSLVLNQKIKAFILEYKKNAKTTHQNSPTPKRKNKSQRKKQPHVERPKRTVKKLT